MYRIREILGSPVPVRSCFIISFSVPYDRPIMPWPTQAILLQDMIKYKMVINFLYVVVRCVSGEILLKTALTKGSMTFSCSGSP